MTIDDVLAHIRAHLDLEAETEYDLLEEIRGHLEDALDAARAQGVDEQAALAQVAARFGVEEVGDALQAAHAGWGTWEGIAAAALPVLFTLVLRWLIFAPDGTAIGWEELLDRPTLWAVAMATLLIPLFRFSRRRYALVGWAIFWGFSLLLVAFPALRW
ncbi:MAG: hypothetical protein JXD18_13890 [Anaerolineae bacterium]|nr:hypothetical protein [Anaerolineae bacterium]